MAVMRGGGGDGEGRVRRVLASRGFEEHDDAGRTISKSSRRALLFD
jgi:hypothetical protein